MGTTKKSKGKTPAVEWDMIKLEWEVKKTRGRNYSLCTEKLKIIEFKNGNRLINKKN